MVPVNVPATGAPTVTGSPQVGAPLSVDTSGITDPNGVPTDAADFTYEWVRVDGANEIESAAQRAAPTRPRHPKRARP